MWDDSLSWISTALDTWLAGIPGGLWTIFAIFLSLLSLYFAYPYAKKLSNQNKMDLNQAKQDIIEANAQSVAKLERCIYERIQVGSQGDPANSLCEGIAEDAKRLQNASSNYDRGLSKAIFGDLDGAEAEFSTALSCNCPCF
jgi:hypothetical protein